jgi:hypothetical protein
MANSVIPRLLTKIREYLRGIDRAVSYVFYAWRKKSMEREQIESLHPTLSSTRYNKGVSFFEIGVGVYQGEFVVIRQQLVDSKPTYRWVVHNLSTQNLANISSQIPKDLFRLASLLECQRQLYNQLKDLKRTDALLELRNCPLGALCLNHQYTSGVSDDGAELHKEQCPVIKETPKLLEHLSQCPLKKIIGETNK